jgi:hypothetical protein
MTLPNNTCAFVFPNDNANDTYDICFQNMVSTLCKPLIFFLSEHATLQPNLGFNIMEECPKPQHDGLVGSVRGSPDRPGVQN